jgi:plastocyanin domain-containing protein
MKRTIVIAMAVCGLLSSGLVANAQNISSNVKLSGGKQEILIEAGEGYNPAKTLARADLPTTLRVKTSGTLDCSLALAIPALGFRKTLPLTGETVIDVPPQRSGSKLQGICSMAMYSFEVTFQ